MRLERSRLRLEQANAHRGRIAKLWNGFIEGDEPYVPVVQVDREGNGVIHVYPSDDFPGDELSLEFGEMLYQLRAALDSLVYEVAILDSGQDPPPDAEKLEFPFRGSEPKFDSVAWKIAPLTKQHQDMIKSVQPYTAGEGDDAQRVVAESLDILNDWARKDRHRGLHVIAHWAANKDPLFDLPDGCALAWVAITHDDSLEKESEVASFRLAGYVPGMEVVADPNLTIDISINEPPQPRDDADTLNARVVNMHVVIDAIIEGFEKTFD